MFEYITGTLIAATPSAAIIDVQGMGYHVHIPFNNYAKLPQLKTSVTLYLSLIVREDSHKLFGFLTQHERDLFENLIAISGIGPKTAIALIGHMPFDELQAAIRQGNIAQVCKIPGIGKKTAERLIVEMRDKISKFSSSEAISYTQNTTMADAISALINLGYNTTQAQKAVKAALSSLDGKAGDAPNLALLITHSLRHI